MNLIIIFVCTVTFLLFSLQHSNCERSKNEATDELFDGGYGRPVFRSIMSKKTFYYLNKVIRFDNVLRRRQQKSPKERNQSERVVFDLIDGLKGHNVTMDNFFSTYELGQKMLQKNLTIVGTNKKINDIYLQNF